MKHATAKDAPMNCEQAWDLIAARDFRTWRGLPQGCTYGSFDARFPKRSDNWGLARLGHQQREVAFRTHPIERVKFDPQVFFEGDELVQVLLEYPHLPHSSAELRDALGAPAAQLDYQMDVVGVGRGAWVYPKRGITLFVDGPPGEVLYISLFHPCSLEHYVDTLHMSSEFHEQRSP